MINSKVKEGMRFEEFVLSVIRQKCVNQSKRFFAGVFDFTDRDAVFHNKNLRNISFEKKEYFTAGFVHDGFAPDGFDEFDMPVIIDVKYNPRNMTYTPLIDDSKCISLYVISSDEKSARGKISGERVIVWGRETISQWEKEYPIDFYAYHLQTSKELRQKADLLDFKQKNESNKELLRGRIRERNISFSLGSGVSMEHGAKSWGDLIESFYQEIQNAEEIDSIAAVQKKIGGTSIINGQFAQDNLKDFMESLYKGLYGVSKSPSLNPATSLHYIAKLASQLCQNPRFNIITYNYDDFLEQLLTAEGVSFKTLYKEENLPDDTLSVYHPHGFLPASAGKSDYMQYKKSIVFGESEYHKLYNDPMSWAMVLQQYLYRYNIYLFVGCSLTDPNLRRILENTKVKAKTHFALMLTDGLTKKDQFTVHKHFMRIGVECIWFDDIDDLKAALATWANGGSVL